MGGAGFDDPQLDRLGLHADGRTRHGGGESAGAGLRRRRRSRRGLGEQRRAESEGGEDGSGKASSSRRWGRLRPEDWGAHGPSVVGSLQRPLRRSVPSSAVSDSAVDLVGIRKRYRGVEALRGADLKISRGEIFGLLGPNGAGKSTLVKILLTLVRPTGGQGTVLGRPLGDRPTLARVGYLPENLRFPDYLTGRQAVDYFASMANVPRRTRHRRAAELLETVGMTRWADRLVRTYSKGMRQRVGLAAALVNDPDLLVLDEPTDGVDPVGRKEIRDILLAAAREGTRSVLLNSHLLSEVESVCTRVAILHRGEVLRQGTLAELAGGARYEIDLAGGGTSLPESIAGLVERLGGTAEAVEPPEDRWRIVVPGHDAEVLQPLLDAARAADRTVLAMRPLRDTLEDLFVAAVGSDGAGGVGGVAERGRP